MPQPAVNTFVAAKSSRPDSDGAAAQCSLPVTLLHCPCPVKPRATRLGNGSVGSLRISGGQERHRLLKYPHEFG